MKDSIIVVEDDVTRSALVSQTLASAGYPEVHVMQAAQTGDIIKREPPVLVVLDVVSLERTGLEIIRMLRRTFGPTGMWIMIVSSPLTEDERLEVWELGVDQVLEQPVSSREIVARVQALLRRVPDTSGHGAGVPEREEGPVNVHGACGRQAAGEAPGDRDGGAVGRVSRTLRAWLAHRWHLTVGSAEHFAVRDNRHAATS